MIRHLSRRLRAGCAILGLSVLTACGLFSSPDARFDPAPLTDFTAQRALAVRWSASVGSGAGYGFVPQVVDGTVYAATPSGGVAALDLQTGAARWSVKTEPLTAGAGSDGHTTAVATATGAVIAFDARGVQRWRTQAASAIDVVPAVGHGIVAVRTSDYRVQAFDAETGELRWNVQRPGPALALRTSMQMRFLPDVLLVGMPNGRLMALDPATGVVRWEDTVSRPRGASDLERISDVVGEPQLVGSLLCAVSYQGQTRCFDLAQGGRAVWSQEQSSATGLGSDENTLYLTDLHDVVRAFDVANGHPRWVQNALRNRRLTAPVSSGTAVVVGDYQGYLHALSRADGHLQARLQLGGGALVSALQPTAGGVLVQTAGGQVVSVRIGD